MIFAMGWSSPPVRTIEVERPQEEPLLEPDRGQPEETQAPKREPVRTA